MIIITIILKKKKKKKKKNNIIKNKNNNNKNNKKKEIKEKIKFFFNNNNNLILDYINEKIEKEYFENEIIKINEIDMNMNENIENKSIFNIFKNKINFKKKVNSISINHSLEKIDENINDEI
jgi:hypothetical protein